MKIGDVVRSENDPQKMCVREIDGNKITCDYFDKQNQPQQEVFEMEKLQIVIGQ